MAFLESGIKDELAVTIQTEQTGSAWVIGNWKQNPASRQQVDVLVTDLVAGLAELPAITDHGCRVMLAPSHVHISQVVTAVTNSQMMVAGQDVSNHSAVTGAFTGDVSAAQLKDAGADWTLIGHSERRQYHDENNAILADKICHAWSQGLGIILCVGESLADYDAGQTLKVLKNQLDVLIESNRIDSSNAAHGSGIISSPDVVVSSDSAEDAATCRMLPIGRLMIAYEPVWAIGTGKVPTIAEVEQVHQGIHAHLQQICPQMGEITVLYGGSVNADNAAVFAASPWVQGALVGGASLDASSFVKIVHAFCQ